MTKDRIGRWSQSSFDSMDQVAHEIDPLGRKTQYTWCSCGSLLTLIDPASHTTSWQHDLQGRTTSKTYADSTAINYVYDKYSSKLRSKTDALSQQTNYLYYPDDNIYQTYYQAAINATSQVTTYWDSNFNRVKSITKNDWGTISYTYNPYIVPLGTPTTGGGMLQLVHNDRMANSDITFVYDNLGRTTNRSINGAANSDSWTFDAMSRVTGETNALGSFAYAYFDDVAGSSKGTTRLASVTYPNSQVTKYSWYPSAGDERLQQIANLKTATGPTISQYSYLYNPAGEIIQWNQLQNNSSVNYSLDYDQAGQLITSQASPGVPSSTYVNQNYFAYDVAANRTGVQLNSVNRVKLGGTVTTGNTLTITVNNSALTGGLKAITYTVVGGDTLSTIATKFAAQITADADMQANGINASANGTVMSIKSASPNITSYSQSTSGGATETIALGVTGNFVENAVIGGTKTTGNTVTITVSDAALSGGQTAITYTVLAGDTLTTIATGLKNAINANAGLTAAGISATSAGTAITIKSTSANATTYSQSTSAGATETISLSINQNGPQTIALAGTKTTGDTITVTVYDAGLTGGLKAVTYTVLAGDTLTSIATGLAAALTADTNLQGIGVSATSAGTVVTLNSNSINQTVLRETTSASATETLALNIPANGIQTAVIAGSKTTGDTVTITVYDAGLATGSQAVTYTVLAGDTLTSIATGVAAAITANSNLSAIGVSATSSSTVVNIKSTSINNTTYAKSTSGGATETIALAPASGVSQYGYNNVNELTSIAPGGAVRFQCTANKALKSATINSLPANLPWSESFNGNAILSNGANNVPVSATDGASNIKTNNYQVPIVGPGSSTLTFDANGNMTSDGTNSYAWDAGNRLIKITYPGSSNNSQFLYNATGTSGQIIETRASAVTSTKQFVRSGSKICEERDASNNVVKKFLEIGQTISGTNYFYTTDHLGSIRDMTDGSGIVQAHYEYDMWGVATKTNGVLDADFQYAGYYAHGPSGLNFTVYRAYSPILGRWINMDPIGEDGGINLFRYGLNRPSSVIDPSGLIDYPVDNFVGRLGTNISVGDVSRGCVDVARILIGNVTGTRPNRPENAPNTKCWVGAGAHKAAKAYCGCDGALWGKQGDGNGHDYGPGFNPNNGNNPFAGGGGDFAYFAFYPGRGYGGMNHGVGRDPQIGYFEPDEPETLNNQYGNPYNTEMWCCTKKK